MATPCQELVTTPHEIFRSRGRSTGSGSRAGSTSREPRRERGSSSIWSVIPGSSRTSPPPTPVAHPISRRTSRIGDDLTAEMVTVRSRSPTRTASGSESSATWNEDDRPRPRSRPRLAPQLGMRGATSSPHLPDHTRHPPGGSPLDQRLSARDVPRHRPLRPRSLALQASDHSASQDLTGLRQHVLRSPPPGPRSRAKRTRNPRLRRDARGSSSAPRLSNGRIRQQPYAPRG